MALRWPLATFMILVGLLGTWAVGMPLFASPDEPSHLYKAYGTAHGQAIGETYVGYPATIREFDIPAGMTTPDEPPGLGLNCYFGKPDVTAACATAPGQVALSTAAVTPPFWYALVGGGARVAGADTSQRAHRMVNAGLCAALFTIALTIAGASRQRRLTPMLLIGLTPMSLMLSGTVNPNGFEIAAFMVLWALSLHAQSSRAPSAAAGLIVGSLFAAVLLSRFAAGMWVAATIVLVGVILGPSDLRRFVNRRFLSSLMTLTGAAVLALFAWSRYAGVAVTKSDTASSWSRWRVITYTVDVLPEFALQMVGRLGWLDTRLPAATYVLAAVFALAQVTGIVMSRNRRLILAGSLLLVTFLVVPLIVNVISAPTAGLIWQGRYSIPLVIGIGPMGMMGWRAIIDSHPASFQETMLTVLRYGACACFAGAEILGFWQTLRRFSVGEHGKIWLTGDLGWRPGVAPMMLIAANVALTLCLCVLVLAATRPGRSRAVTESPDRRLPAFSSTE